LPNINNDLLLPQGKNYGLDGNLKPDQGFTEYLLNGDKIANTLNFLKLISVGESADYDELAIEVLGDNMICKSQLWLFGEGDGHTFKLTLHATAQNMSHLTVNKKTIDALNRINERSIQTLKNCLSGTHRYVYINTNCVMNKNIWSHLHEDTLHSSTFIVSKQSGNHPVLLQIESSITGGELYNVYLEIMTASIMDLIKTLGYSNITYVSYEADSCPMYNIQGETGTCTYFSIYLIFLYILNGSRSKIYNTMHNITLEDRLRSLSQFIYYVYNTMKPRIHAQNEKFTRDVKLFRGVWALPS